LPESYSPPNYPQPCIPPRRSGCLRQAWTCAGARLCALAGMRVLLCYTRTLERTLPLAA
jgi:hypothetical protein